MLWSGWRGSGTSSGARAIVVAKVVGPEVYPSAGSLTKHPDNRFDSLGIHRCLLSWTGHDSEVSEERRTHRMAVVFHGTISSKGDTK
jgi:hypothetical protein